MSPFQDRSIEEMSNASGLLPLKLLLFIDERPSSQENALRIQHYLESLKSERSFELKIIEIGTQPHLVEHFRLVATPALVKTYPEPRQILAGSNLIAQLKRWWPQWQVSAPEPEVMAGHTCNGGDASSATELKDSNGYSDELMLLSDEIFRLKREKEELLEQLKFKDQVLAMLVHDLRSPLTAASIAVETLELADQQQESQRTVNLRVQLYKQARRQFKLMNRMITDLLQASRGMSAQLNVQHRKLRLQELCEDILLEFTRRCQTKCQELQQDVPQDLPDVYADGELIQQVIVNLFENALKYTPEGGKIHFSILHRTSQKIQVSICDSGPGIPTEKQDQIFEGHFRLKRDEEKDGYGLGLAFCRKIIRAHYGQIWVDSTLNQGSCFHFTLPVYR